MNVAAPIMRQPAADPAGRLRDKVAVVTGGGRGIGATFCEALATAGAKVVIGDLRDATAVARSIAQAGGQAIYRHTDVAAADSVAALVSQAMQEFGSIDILVNNAAIFADLVKKPFTEIDSTEWDAVMAVNARGPFECAKAVAPQMIARRRGKIINIASGTVFKGTAGALHYVSSKGAVVAMTRCLARELGPYNICVNAIAPGITMSEAVIDSPVWGSKASEGTVATRALRREELPADLVGTLLFLASADSDFVTGQTIVVDGGAVMR
jgi:NAD(P)-dependent dehydrogenase (short-subunit alcohol dehydrogenase family)